MSFDAKNVQFSGVMPGGHGSASFDVPVGNAYIVPPKAITPGSWIVLRDNAHELFEGEVLSCRPIIEGSAHKFAVECGGMISVAGKRRDVSQTWVHRGAADWIRRPGTSEVGTFINDGSLELRVPAGSTESFNASTLPTWLQCYFVLDDMLTDQYISYISYVGTVDTRTEAGGQLWSAVMDVLPSFEGTPTVVSTQANANAAWTGVYAPPAGTKIVRLLLYSNTGAHTVANTPNCVFTQFDIYSSERTTKLRIDEAMVDLAMRPGLALSYTSSPVGAMLDDLRVGSGVDKTSVADGLQTLADYHAQPFDWGFWDNRAFDVRPRLSVPENDSKVIVVGGGNPGLVSWDVAPVDEDVPDYACVLFGNKDNANMPEKWPRRLYRPATPPDDNVKLETLDYSDRILSDKAAAALGDNLVGVSSNLVPSGYSFRVHPALAKTGLWPGNNTDPTSSYQDLSNYGAAPALTGFASTEASGWSGTNSPSDPSKLTFDGTDLVTIGDLSQLDLGTGARTMTCWGTLASIGGAQPIFDKSTTAAGYIQGWQLGVNTSGKLKAYISTNSGAAQYRDGAGSTTMLANTWYHMAFVYAGSGGNWSLYLDGVSETVTSGGAAGAWTGDNAVSAALGRGEVLSATRLTGSLGSVTIWPRALTDAEVKQDYDSGMVLYNRSLAKGNAVLSGTVKNRKGSLIPAAYVRAGWWIQNTELQDNTPLYITGHNVDMSSKTNALTIGQDYMEDAIGAKAAEFLTIPETAADETAEDGSTNAPNYWPVWSA